jgi:hypothetical protein
VFCKLYNCYIWTLHFVIYVCYILIKRATLKYSLLVLPITHLFLLDPINKPYWVCFKLCPEFDHFLPSSMLLLWSSSINHYSNYCNWLLTVNVFSTSILVFLSTHCQSNHQKDHVGKQVRPCQCCLKPLTKISYFLYTLGWATVPKY